MKELFLIHFAGLVIAAFVDMSRLFCILQFATLQARSVFAFLRLFLRADLMCTLSQNVQVDLGSLEPSQRDSRNSV